MTAMRRYVLRSPVWTRLLQVLVLITSFAAAPCLWNGVALPVARAQSGDAAEHFRRGKELYDEGDFQASLIEFKRAYDKAPDYRVLFNIGQVQYQLGDYASAMETLEQYLAEGGDQIKADRREAVQNDIARLAKRVATVEITVNVPGATIFVDDAERGSTPLDGPVAISAGRRKIKARKEGYVDAEKVIDVAGGDQAEVSLELRELGGGTTFVPKGDDDDDDGDEAGTSAPWEAWTVTAAFGAGSLVFGLLALSAKSQLDDALSAPTTADEVGGIRTRMIAFSVVTDVMLVGTAVAGAVAIYFTVAGSEDDEADAEVSLGVGPGSLYLHGSF